MTGLVMKAICGSLKRWTFYGILLAAPFFPVMWSMVNPLIKCHILNHGVNPFLTMWFHGKILFLSQICLSYLISAYLKNITSKAVLMLQGQRKACWRPCGSGKKRRKPTAIQQIQTRTPFFAICKLQCDWIIKVCFPYFFPNLFPQVFRFPMASPRAGSATWLKLANTPRAVPRFGLLRFNRVWRRGAIWNRADMVHIDGIWMAYWW